MSGRASCPPGTSQGRHITTSNPPAARRGCRGRGCLAGCVALVLLPAALVVLGLTVARPALETRWAAWRAERPWVDQLLGAAATARELLGSAEADSAGGTTRAEDGGRLAGANDRSRMPPDLPLWPEAMAETFSAGSDHAAAYQRVRDRADAVLRFYRRTMPARGWRLEQERTGANGTLLLYRKPDRTARVEVVADSGTTDIWLRSRRLEATP